jgi:hypothetical protein
MSKRTPSQRIAREIMHAQCKAQDLDVERVNWLARREARKREDKAAVVPLKDFELLQKIFVEMLCKHHPDLEKYRQHKWHYEARLFLALHIAVCGFFDIGVREACRLIVNESSRTYGMKANDLYTTYRRFVREDPNLPAYVAPMAGEVARACWAWKEDYLGISFAGRPEPRRVTREEREKPNWLIEIFQEDADQHRRFARDRRQARRDPEQKN